MFETSVRACQACNLVSNCRRPVPGEGSVHASVFLVAQSPGADEDKAGRPLIGASGRELRDALTRAGLDNVYLTNAVKCHPPGNRKAKVAEREACRQWIDAELAMWAPPETHVLVLAGEEACKTFYPKLKLADARHSDDLEYEGHPVVVIQHPAAMLHNPTARPIFERDIKKVARRVLGVGADTTPYIAIGENAWELFEYMPCPVLEGYRPLTIGLDTEFRPDGTMIGWSIAWGAGAAAYISADAPGSGDVLALILDAAPRWTIVLHSAQADVPVICKYLDWPLDAWPWYQTQDTCLAAYVMREPTVGLKDLAFRHFGVVMLTWEDMGGAEVFAELPIEEQARYAAADPDLTRRLWVEKYADAVEGK